MSMIETLSDEKNSFLSRREIICDFKGLGGKLKKLEAVEMITKEFKLDGKIVIPMKLQNRTGQPKITGTFYVYDDEKLAREHVSPIIFDRLDKAKSPKEEKKLQMQNQQRQMQNQQRQMQNQQRQMQNQQRQMQNQQRQMQNQQRQMHLLINLIQKQKTKVKITNGWKKRT